MTATNTTTTDTPTELQIGPAAHCPIRSCRQFPYAMQEGDGPEVAAAILTDISEILEGVEGMIVAGVGKRFTGAGDAAMRDIAQEIRIGLWRRSIPRFDVSRGAMLTTFLYQCINTSINQHVRLIVRDNIRRRRHPLETLDGLTRHVAIAPDQSIDRRIEALAAAIIAHPEQILTVEQTKVFRAVLEMPPDGQLQHLAEQLGYARAPSLSMMLRRIKDRITAIDIEGFDLANLAAS